MRGRNRVDDLKWKDPIGGIRGEGSDRKIPSAGNRLEGS